VQQESFSGFIHLWAVLLLLIGLLCRRFAAKEAVFKAVHPLYRLKWRDFSVTKSTQSTVGPFLEIYWKCPSARVALQNAIDVCLSISHDGDYACAIAVASRKSSC
jgi:phosphopantetheinyl transferase (holo-ACP synthase)